MRVLQLLSQHPWRLRPLLIDPDHELTDAQAASLHTAFDQVCQVFCQLPFVML